VARGARATVGREAERAALAARLQALRAGESGTVLIEGEPGIGKSHLVAHVVDQAEALGIRRLIGAADSVERSTSYHGWRTVFTDLLGLDNVTDPQERRERVLAQFAGDAE